LSLELGAQKSAMQGTCGGMYKKIIKEIVVNIDHWESDINMSYHWRWVFKIASEINDLLAVIRWTYGAWVE
jgi:hypothetical protein